MRLDADLQQAGHQGEAGGGADLAQQAVEPGRVGAQLRRQCRQSERDQRREQHPAADRLQRAAGNNPDRPIDRRDRRQQQQARRHQQPSGREQDAVIDPAAHLTDQQHGGDHQGAARHDRQAGHRRTVAQRALGDGRQKHDGREQDRAHEKIVRGGEREIQILQNLEPQDRRTQSAGPHRH